MVSVREGILIGSVLRPHGLTGELRVRMYSDAPQRYLKQKCFYRAQGNDLEPLAVDSIRSHGSLLLIRFQGISDRTQAEALGKPALYLLPSDLEPAQEGEYYIRDLIGLQVLKAEGRQVIGVVDYVFTAGESEVLRVKPAAGGKLLHVPFIEQAVPEVDLEAGVLTVNSLFLEP